MYRILVINPGSTSTKVAICDDAHVLQQATLGHGDAELSQFQHRPILDQLELRLAAITEWLRAHNASETRWHAVAGRGGLLKPLRSGTYVVDDTMLSELRAAARGEHASNLGAFLAYRIAQSVGCPAVIVDPVSVDELEDAARLTGLCGLERVCLSHALNAKAVAKRYAADAGRSYPQLRLIVVHLGSGISVSAHRDGRMIDVNNSREEGPFSADRTGGLPVLALVQRALAEGWSAADAERRLFREGGIFSYLGTRAVADAVRRANSGDARAQAVLAAMLYQVKKEVGALAAVLEGSVDAILLTGGMAHAAEITQPLVRSLEWIAPVHVYAGEDELRALAEGAVRALSAAEPLLTYA